MSGPKCDSYYVEEDRNELLLAAQRAEAERAARIARERLEAAMAKGKEAQQKMARMAAAGCNAEVEFGATVDALHQSLPQMPASSGSVQQIEKYIQAVESTIAQITAEIGRAEGVSRLRSLVSASTSTIQVTDWSSEFAQRKQASRSEEAESRHHLSAEVVDRIVGRLRGAATEKELESIQQIVQEITKVENSGRADSLEAELRLRVQRVNERLMKEQRDMAQANELLVSLRGLKGNAVELVRQELMKVMNDDGNLSNGLVERANDARVQATKRANDEYAGKVVREELQRLGYVVGEEFSTLFVSGGQVVVSRPEELEYGVEMQVDASHGTVDLQVVRLSDSSGDNRPQERQQRDKSAEVRWCSDHDKLRSAMRTRGLGGRVLKHLPPGAIPVPVKATGGARGTRRAERSKQREL